MCGWYSSYARDGAVAGDSEPERGELVIGGEVRVARRRDLDRVEQLRPAQVRMLVDECQQAEEATDGLPRRPEVRVPDAPRAVRHVRGQRLVGHEVPGRVTPGVHVPQLGQQHEHVLRGQVRQPEHGSGVIDPVGRGEGVVGQPGRQRRVREQAAPRVEQELGRTAEQEPQLRGAALQAVVDDPQDLLVVGVPGGRTGELVEVDHLVDADQQPAEAGEPDEARHQLEVVVDGGVVDDRPHAEGGPRVHPAGELATQPAHRVGTQPFVAAVVAAPVRLYHGGEVVPARQLGQRREPGGDRLVRPGTGGVGLADRAGHEPLDDARQRPAVGAGPGGEVADQLGVQAAGLAGGRVQAAVGRQVRVRGDQPPLQRDRPDQVQEERLTRAVLADDEPAGGTAVGDAVEVAQHGPHLGHPTDLDVLLPEAGHDPGAQRRDDRVPFPGPDPLDLLRRHVGGHPSSSCSTSTLTVSVASPSMTGAPVASSAASLSRSSAPSGRTSCALASAANSWGVHDGRAASTRSSRLCGRSRPATRSARPSAGGCCGVGGSSPVKTSARSVPTASVSATLRAISARSRATAGAAGTVHGSAYPPVAGSAGRIMTGPSRPDGSPQDWGGPSSGAVKPDGAPTLCSCSLRNTRSRSSPSIWYIRVSVATVAGAIAGSAAAATRIRYRPAISRPVGSRAVACRGSRSASTPAASNQHRRAVRRGCPAGASRSAIARSGTVARTASVAGPRGSTGRAADATAAAHRTIVAAAANRSPCWSGGPAAGRNRTAGPSASGGAPKRTSGSTPTPSSASTSMSAAASSRVIRPGAADDQNRRNSAASMIALGHPPRCPCAHSRRAPSGPPSGSTSSAGRRDVAASEPRPSGNLASHRLYGSSAAATSSTNRTSSRTHRGSRSTSGRSSRQTRVAVRPGLAGWYLSRMPAAASGGTSPAPWRAWYHVANSRSNSAGQRSCAARRVSAGWWPIQASAQSAGTGVAVAANRASATRTAMGDPTGPAGSAPAAARVARGAASNSSRASSRSARSRNTGPVSRYRTRSRRTSVVIADSSGPTAGSSPVSMTTRRSRPKQNSSTRPAGASVCRPSASHCRYAARVAGEIRWYAVGRPGRRPVGGDEESSATGRSGLMSAGSIPPVIERRCRPT